MKTFTLEEAQSMLPLVESLLNRALENKQAAEELDEKLSALSRRIHLAGGMRIDVAQIAGQRSAMEKHIQHVRETIAEIDEIVLLCWKSGETAIEHWHTLESGFKGRKPIDDRFRRRTNPNSRPN